MRKKCTVFTLLAVVFLITQSTNLLAQTNFGQLRGTVYNAVDKKIIDFASVVLRQEGNIVVSAATNLQGEFSFSTLTPGEYQLMVTHLDYDTVLMSVTISADEYTMKEIFMNNISSDKSKAGRILGVVSVGSTRKKEIVIVGPVHTLRRVDIERLPNRDLTNFAILYPGVNLTSTGVSFRGSRSDGTAIYLDGVRMIGPLSPMQAALGQVSVYNNGVPSQFGDFTGGAISASSRPFSNKHKGSFELISSTPSEFFRFGGNKFENDNRFRAANRFDYNQMEGYASGPLYTKNKGQLGKEKIVLGYLVAGNINYTRDPNPSYAGVYIVKSDKLQEIERTPLTPNRDGGLVHSGNFITMQDVENRRVRPNSALQRANFQGKLDFRPNKNTFLVFLTNFQYSGGSSSSNSIMNYDLNPMSENYYSLSYLSFTQKLPTKLLDSTQQTNKIRFRNAYYTVKLDYQNIYSKGYDPIHEDRIFDYGYIGKFDRYQTENYTYRGDINNPNQEAKMYVDQNGDTVFLRNYYEQIGFQDTAYKFTRADKVIEGDRGININPLRANYTSNLYDYYNERGIPVVNELQILQDQGLLNGTNPPNVYSIWSTPGNINTSIRKNQTERINLTAMIESQLFRPSKNGRLSVPHDIQFGFVFEQTFSRGWGLNANRLWYLMPQLMNSHLTELDRANPILSYDENGVFLDTVRYNRFVNSSMQTNFDKNFRNKIINEGKKDNNGNNVNEKSFVEVNSFTPDDLKLDMFNADELLNNGSSLVRYYGYDHLGNIVRGKPSVEDFTNNPNQRLLGAFQPVYTAAWIQDKFAYKDIIFRVGLRVERFDANQLVLKDPYSLYPIKTVSEVSEIGNTKISHPDNMGEDYKVYVNDSRNPTRVLGYRNEDNWFDSEGNELTNPEIIANQTNSGRIAPYLADPNNQKITRNSFRDYLPEINVLPRVLFSFPIRQDANFYASFDMLAQRPLEAASFMTLDNYYYMDQRNSGALANPNLKPRIKTEYQIGFKQMVGESSAFELGAYYAEIKNDIQLFQYNQAYPVSYLSYQNIDFSTIKGFSAQYEKYGDYVSITANYTLQYADGTGSNPNASAALIASGQPNLRTLFPLGELDIRHQLTGVFNYNFGGSLSENKYNGPRWGERFLQNVNFNIVYSANSGLPYTRTNVPTQFGSADRANIKGTPFGSRLPWQQNIDINLSKSFTLKRGISKTGNKRKPLSANCFLWVNNVFNLGRIQTVYSYTGEALDDGFINSPRGQQAVSEQLSAQSYTDLYRMLVNNPGNFMSPRFARVGIKFNF